MRRPRAGVLQRCRLAVLLSTMAALKGTEGNVYLPRHVGSNCSVCRGVAQGFVDLHTEWPLVRKMEVAEVNGDPHGGSEDVPVTHEDAIARFCHQTFLSNNQQRVCYAIAPFMAEVAQWLRMGIPPDRVCRKLGSRNPDICFDARGAERPNAGVLDWHRRPPFIPEGVECSVEHRTSLAPRWVLLD